MTPGAGFSRIGAGARLLILACCLAAPEEGGAAKPAFDAPLASLIPAIHAVLPLVPDPDVSAAARRLAANDPSGSYGRSALLPVAREVRRLKVESEAQFLSLGEAERAGLAAEALRRWKKSAGRLSEGLRRRQERLEREWEDRPAAPARLERYARQAGDLFFHASPIFDDGSAELIRLNAVYGGFVKIQARMNEALRSGPKELWQYPSEVLLEPAALESLLGRTREALAAERARLPLFWAAQDLMGKIERDGRAKVDRLPDLGENTAFIAARWEETQALLREAQRRPGSFGDKQAEKLFDLGSLVLRDGKVRLRKALEAGLGEKSEVRRAFRIYHKDGNRLLKLVLELGGKDFVRRKASPALHVLKHDLKTSALRAEDREAWAALVPLLEGYGEGPNGTALERLRVLVSRHRRWMSARTDYFPSSRQDSIDRVERLQMIFELIIAG